MRFTVLGSVGFIGSQLTESLRRSGHEVTAIGRDESSLPGSTHGHVIDCAGLTSDFRTRSADTVEAHVCRVLRNLRDVEFASYLLLSSTRVYRRSATGGEGDALAFLPEDPDDLYGASKILGELLCLGDARAGLRAVRLSNVYGPDFESGNFLFALIRAGIGEHRIVLRGSPDTPRDFVSVKDVVEMLPRIAATGRHRLYNLAAGRSIKAGDVASMVARVTDSTVDVQSSENTFEFPVISIDRIRSEYGFEPRQLEDELEELVDVFRREMSVRGGSAQ